MVICLYLHEGGNWTFLFENVKDTLIKSTFWIIIILHYTTSVSLPPKLTIKIWGMSGRNSIYSILLSSHLDYFYILKIFFLKNRSDRNPALYFFLREYPAIYKSFYLFTVVTIPFINFISVILCLSCHCFSGASLIQFFPAFGVDLPWMLIWSALSVIVWSNYK